MNNLDYHTKMKPIFGYLFKIINTESDFRILEACYSLLGHLLQNQEIQDTVDENAEYFKTFQSQILKYISLSKNGDEKNFTLLENILYALCNLM